jgi:hypothetical protein
MSNIGRGGEALGVIDIILHGVIGNKLVKKISKGCTRVCVDGSFEAVVGTVKSIENRPDQLIVIQCLPSGCKFSSNGLLLCNILASREGPFLGALERTTKALDP